ncbi:tyrosine transporter [Testudinibacter sp. TR-2022]|uniref:aromatic amino acid transport family protein n=2 Tax=Testudinibacter sp. TR-2022 TaxID=2585029 RepID=UPI00111957F5|nr:aromatic amino acid transport family protein [Testudinibacter sp. TR-2022]TNH04682.1 tyrosine transporter [Pasteurellaceae bacterium Phil31]TNH10136.1 tyrosine transporter [Testudinibacter sp. TR-2022]TNH12515.1 tyrosine transporter [Testudinibacter sp. TR-2022]TNH17090.1 tyrosine transporter [Testudinibacter sp. TR-2022]
MKNKTLGGTLLVAGTTIGAGMLAMPITSAGMGFSFTIILLLILWLLLSYSALLFIEVYQTARIDDGLATLAEQYFGAFGRIISTLSLLIFMYAILSAYVTGGGSLINGLLSAGLGYDTGKLSIILFTVVLGIFIIIGTSSVDAVNRLFFFSKIAVFLFVLLMMLPRVSMDNLMAMPINNALMLSAAPVFFTSFGFHVVIPSIVKYLEGDIRRLRIAILVGTGIPLFAYLLWQLSTHGVLSQSQFLQILQQDPTLNGLVNATREITGSTVLSEAIRVFSSLALITSFLGVALSLFDCLKDLLNRVKVRSNRASLGLLTFLPPLVFALFYPEGFIMALNGAGVMFAFYGLVLPVGLAWKARRQSPNLAYRVWGGNPSLLFALLLGILIIAIPFLVDKGYLPHVIG